MLILRKKALVRQPVGSPVRCPELSKGAKGLGEKGLSQTELPRAQSSQRL